MLHKTKPVIAIDIDDVIAAFAESFVKYSNERWGTHLTVDDYQEHWGEMWNVDHEEVLRRASEYHEPDQTPEYNRIPGAEDVLRILKDRFTIIAVTSRRSSINQLTRDWLEKYYNNIFDDIIFCGFFDSGKQEGVYLTKGDIVRDVGAKYFIDDQLKHVLAVAAHDIEALLFGDYFWNKTDDLPKNVTRTKNWNEVADYFKDK